jgi:hypothetical protein
MELLRGLFGSYKRCLFVLVHRYEGGLHGLHRRMQHGAVRAELDSALLEHHSERADHLRQQPSVVTLAVVASDDAGGATDGVAASAEVLVRSVVELAPFRRTVAAAAAERTNGGSVLLDGLERVLLERFHCEVELYAPTTEVHLALRAPMSGVGRICFVLAVVAFWSWTWPRCCHHAGEHHPVGRERGGSAAKRVTAVGNRTLLAVAVGCAPIAHVVQAPKPLHCARIKKEGHTNAIHEK